MHSPAPPENLELATRVEGGAGTYTAALSPRWEIWGPNGGYLAAIALRAAGAEAAIKNPATFYCQFLRVARFEAIDASVSVVQSGRRSESIRVSLTQAGKPVLEGLLRTALPGDGLEHEAYSAPEVPAPETLPTYESLLHAHHPRFTFWDNIECRVVLSERFEPDRPSLPDDWVEWYRFRPMATFEDPFVDAARSLILIDTLSWPATWLKHPNPAYLGPSLDVVTFFHASAQHSEWLLAHQTAPIAKHGLIGGTGRVFDRAGKLVASGGAQLLSVKQ